jgi:hypothetical protein
MRSLAGVDIEAAVLYPEEERCLIGGQWAVAHYEDVGEVVRWARAGLPQFATVMWWTSAVERDRTGIAEAALAAGALVTAAGGSEASHAKAREAECCEFKGAGSLRLGPACIIMVSAYTIGKGGGW